MALFFSKPIMRDDGNEGYYVCLQDAFALVEVRILAKAFSQEAGSLQESAILKAFEGHRAKIEAIANQKYDAEKFDQHSGKKIIWIAPDNF